MSTREIARGGLLAAAATAWLYFGGVMPQIGPAACLIAGAASAIPLLRRANVKTAVLLYLVTSVLGLLLTPRKLIAAAYVLLFGLYPIVKYLIECRLPVFTQLSGKLAYFNIVLVLAAVLVSCGLFPQVQMPGIFRLAGLWIAANIGFIVYDIGLSKVIALLRRTLPPEYEEYDRLRTCQAGAARQNHHSRAACGQPPLSGLHGKGSASVWLSG